MEKSLFLNIFLVGIIAGCIALAINFALARSTVYLLKVPVGFAPLTFLPILTGCLGGALLAGTVYLILHFLFENPQIPFVFIAFTALLFSFNLPFRLTNHRSPRFLGATRQVQLVLCLMHTVVAATTVLTFLFLTE